MNHSKAPSLFAIVIPLALVVSSMMASPAFADDETPPPTDTSTDAAPPTTDSSAAVTEPAPQEGIPALPAKYPQGEGTDLVVLDETGQSLPLATESAAEAIADHDPIWCPTGASPKPGLGGCSGSFASLAALTAGFVPPAKNGTIWIQSGADPGVIATINGLGTWAPEVNFNLTLRGGWTGVSGSTVIEGSSVFDSAINIVNWNGIVTLNDISSESSGNAYTPSAGAIYVTTARNIVVSNVAVTSSSGGFLDGIYLDNTSSTIQATVTVKNSTFNNNSFRGMSIYSDGAVTLTNVNANNNLGEDGVLINNDNDAFASIVTVTKGFFDSNTKHGLEVLSNGAIKLSQISGNSNFNDGVYIKNTYATTAQPVIVSGFLTAYNNTSSGLYIESDGVVTLTNLVTDHNGAYGTYIDNTSATVQLPVTINGNNVFDDNAFNGLKVTSHGAIKTNNVTASGNGFDPGDYSGVFMYNDNDTTKPQNITMNGVNLFHQNSFDGLTLYSYGIITLSNLTATSNGKGVVDGFGNGAYIVSSGGTASKPVSLKGTNYFADNEADGLYVYTVGSITISNITSVHNASGYGAELKNQYSLFQNPVTISGYGVFEQNNLDGLNVQSNGAITITNLTADLNAGGGAVLFTIGLTKPQVVNLKGNNSFQWNGNAGTESGLRIDADGKITVNNLYAANDFYRGLWLDNYTNWFAGTFLTFGSISQTGYVVSTSNGSAGMYFNTHGTLTLTNLTSTMNSSDGVSVYANGNVTISCAMITHNAWGLWMYASAPLLTIKGLVSSANPGGDNLWATTLVRTRCP